MSTRSPSFSASRPVRSETDRAGRTHAGRTRGCGPHLTRTTAGHPARVPTSCAVGGHPPGRRWDCCRGSRWTGSVKCRGFGCGGVCVRRRREGWSLEHATGHATWGISIHRGRRRSCSGRRPTRASRLRTLIVWRSSGLRGPGVAGPGEARERGLCGSKLRCPPGLTATTKSSVGRLHGFDVEAWARPGATNESTTVQLSVLII